jgi:hypothetical protein
VMKILLIGRNQWVVDGAKEQLGSESLMVLGALSVDDVQRVLVNHRVEHVFVGPGLDIETRLDSIRQVFAHSNYTTVHLKDHSTGPEGGINFVKAILRGLAELDGSGT